MAPSMKLASTIRHGDTIIDGPDRATVFAGPTRSPKHSGNRVAFLARRDDRSVVRVFVDDTALIPVA